MVIVTIWVGDDIEKKEMIELKVETDEGASVEAVAEEITAVMLKWLTSWTRYSGANLSFKRG